MVVAGPRREDTLPLGRMQGRPRRRPPAQHRGKAVAGGTPPEVWPGQRHCWTKVWCLPGATAACSAATPWCPSQLASRSPVGLGA